MGPDVEKSQTDRAATEQGSEPKRKEQTPAEIFVRYALSIGALELVPEGRALKSGRISPYFFNSGLFKTGGTLSQLAMAYASVVYKGKDRPDVLFGPAYKGIPLVAAIAVTLADDIEFSFNRKEAKDHGEGGIIVGAPLAGKKVLIVDDVMTTGTSIIEAAEIIKAEGGTPIGCLIAFDRQEKGKEGDLSAVQDFQQKHGIPVVAAATLEDLIYVLETAIVGDEDLDSATEDLFTGMIPRILAYKAQYGAVI